MAEAKYTVMVPTHDNLGNPLKDLATGGHHYLHAEAGISGSRVEGPVKGNWEDDPQEDFNMLVSFADDTPENDSHFKALARNIAVAANQWGVFVSKESSSGPQSWLMDNPSYDPDQPAADWAIQPNGDPFLAFVKRQQEVFDNYVGPPATW